MHLLARPWHSLPSGSAPASATSLHRRRHRHRHRRCRLRRRRRPWAPVATRAPLLPTVTATMAARGPSTTCALDAPTALTAGRDRCVANGCRRRRRHHRRHRPHPGHAPTHAISSRMATAMMVVLGANFHHVACAVIARIAASVPHAVSRRRRHRRRRRLQGDHLRLTTDRTGTDRIGTHPTGTGHTATVRGGFARRSLASHIT